MTNQHISTSDHKIERMITDTIHVLENEYFNPFGVNLDNDKLYNLSSGVTVTHSLADSILTVIIKDKNCRKSLMSG